MQLYSTLAINIGSAWLAGGLIGVERSFHGRAAGFRTHCIVALAAAAVMTVSLAPGLQPALFPAAVLIDTPGRVAQGVMTGVGFLGAGVIYRAGVNVQGLTTAATVWATSAIGLLFGLGLYAPAVVTTLAVMATLILLRWAELWMPSNVYVWAIFRFREPGAPSAAALTGLICSAEISLSEPSYARVEGGTVLEYSGTLRARRPAALHDLAERLRSLDGLVGYELQRISK